MKQEGNQSPWLKNFAAYREFRWNKLNTPQFSHLWYLLYWPLYGTFFLLVERVWTNRDWLYVWCPLDDMIPFCEIFVFPYMFWFVFLCGMLLFTLLFEPRTFRRMMVFIAITYSVTMIIYLICPTAQNLRPDLTALGRDNALVRFMVDFYAFDTNTNVCPSIHVIGSVAVLFTGMNSEFFRKKTGWQVFFWVTALLISVSTVFLKQHSVLDVLWAIPLCVVTYPFAYCPEAVAKKVLRIRAWIRAKRNKKRLLAADSGDWEKRK